MHRANYRIHRETVRGELDGFSVYGAVQIINSESIRIFIFDKVENVNICIII